MNKRNFLRTLGSVAAGAMLHIIEPLRIKATEGELSIETIKVALDYLESQAMEPVNGYYLLISDPNAFKCYNIGPVPR